MIKQTNNSRNQHRPRQVTVAKPKAQSVLIKQKSTFEWRKGLTQQPYSRPWIWKHVCDNNTEAEHFPRPQLNI